MMASSTDPVGTGFVASLARPGGNVTGLSMVSSQLSAKRLEMLREIVTGLSRVAISGILMSAAPCLTTKKRKALPDRYVYSFNLLK